MAFFDLIQSIDTSIVRFIREYISCAFLDFLMPLITLFGEDGLFWIVLTVCLLVFGKTRKAGLVMALSLLIGLIIGNLTLKPLVDRPRPYEIDGVEILVNKLSDGSFPSGHTLCCFEGAVSLILCGYKKWGRAALVLAFFVAISRVYLYVHFPTDIIAGAILGTFFAVMAYFVVGKIYKANEKSKTL